MNNKLRHITALSLSLGAVALACGNAESNPASIDANCGVFPSAAGVPANAPSLPDQRAWNQDVSGAPVRPDSDRIIRWINAHGDSELHPDFGSRRDYGIPVKVVGKSTKPVKVKFTAYGDESSHGKYRVPLSSPIEGGAYPAADGDRHVIAYDKSRCRLYELYQAFRKRNRWEADSGVIWNLRDAGLRQEGFTSADAAGLPVFPGLARVDELQAGAINHAMRVVFDHTRDAWIHPATHCAGDTDDPAAPSMGLRLRLRGSYDTSKITGQAGVIATALKHYGLIVADNGSNWFFGGTSDRRWDDESLDQLKGIPTTAFEVVQSQAPDQPC
jgi:hypothetical protein